MSMPANHPSSNSPAAVITCIAITAHLLLLLAQSSLIGDLIIPDYLLFANWLQVILITIPIIIFLFKKAWQNTTRNWQILSAAAVLYALISVASSFLAWISTCQIPWIIYETIGAFNDIRSSCAPTSANSLFMPGLKLSSDLLSEIHTYQYASKWSLGYWSLVYLAPATIISLAFCAPQVMTPRNYRIIFLTCAGVLVAHSLLAIGFIISETHCIFGRDIALETGRAKCLLGRHLTGTEGLFANPNSIGSFLMYIPAIILHELHELHELREIHLSGRLAGIYGTLLVVSMIVILAAIFLTFSRGAQLTVILALLIHSIAIFRKSPMKSMIFCTILSLFAYFAISPAQLSQDCKTCIKRSVPTKSNNGSSSQNLDTGRTELWRKFLADSVDAPPLGVGLLRSEQSGLTPHNFLLANYIYFGLPGMIALLFLLSGLGARLFSRVMLEPKRLMPIACIIASSVFLHGQFEYVITYPLFFSNSIFWVLTGFACFSISESKLSAQKK